REKVTIYFDHVGQGLVKRGRELTGFTIAGSDQRFLTAKAEIVGDTVVVTNPAVRNPNAVRYCWANYPTGNLYNREGLPASPFRTDDYQFPLPAQAKPGK